MNARALALEALARWRHGKEFADAIVQVLLSKNTLGGSDRGFATELFYGVLRNLTLLDFWIEQLRSGSIDHDSRDLLRLGLYQIFLLGTPAHAAVFETVELSARRRRPLINGVLRAAARRADELKELSAAADLTTRCSHPRFIVERWQEAYGAEAAAALCAWDNQPALIYARVNQLRTTIEQFLAEHPTAEAVAG